MYQGIRKKAKKKVQAKLAFYICALVFTFVTIILMMISFYLPEVAFWLRLPIPVFIMVLGILYLVAFGLPTDGFFSENWQEDEIEKEMVRIYRKRLENLPIEEETSEIDKLELKELERLENKWRRDSWREEDDFV